MAEIRICALDRSPSYGGGGGPDIPARLFARLDREAIFKPQTEVEIPVVRLHLGDDTVRLWPADPDRLEELAESIRSIASELRQK